MCYILDPMKRQVADWVAMGVDARRCCAKIHRANGETCGLFHESRVAAAEDWTGVRAMVPPKSTQIFE